MYTKIDGINKKIPTLLFLQCLGLTWQKVFSVLEYKSSISKFQLNLNPLYLSRKFLNKDLNNLV